MSTYERLMQRIADGKARAENVEIFEQQLATLPKPQWMLDAEQYEQLRRERADRQAYVELVREARHAGDFAALRELLAMAFDELDEMLADERKPVMSHNERTAAAFVKYSRSR